MLCLVKRNGLRMWGLWSVWNVMVVVRVVRRLGVALVVLRGSIGMV